MPSRFIQQTFQVIELAGVERQVVCKVACGQATPAGGFEKSTRQACSELADSFLGRGFAAAATS